MKFNKFGLLQFMLLEATIQKKKIVVQTDHQGVFSNSHANCRGGSGFHSAVLYGYLTANCLNKAYFGNHKIKTRDSE